MELAHCELYGASLLGPLPVRVKPEVLPGLREEHVVDVVAVGPAVRVLELGERVAAQLHDGVAHARVHEQVLLDGRVEDARVRAGVVAEAGDQDLERGRGRGEWWYYIVADRSAQRFG